MSTASDPHKSKVFNDPIHGPMKFNSLCVAIIDTPQFQRLRYIKQLGAAYFVFPGASHNRFEHSLGVGYLAGEFANALKNRQPDFEISEKDVLCVQIAGLCHDLGHGPFSHMFESMFIPQTRKNASDGKPLKWRHEEYSVKMFDYLIENNKLKEKFKDFGLEDQDREIWDQDIMFIKEQINGGPIEEKTEESTETVTATEWKYKGRPEEKGFLYEIVANKRNGIDVDKWDYFARDCHHLGIGNNFDHWRFIEFAKVMKVKNGSKESNQICSRDKEALDLYDMFYTRNALHRRAYKHKNCCIIEYMLNEALKLADDFLKFPKEDGTMLKLSETIDDMHAYSLVNDSVYHMIRQSTYYVRLPGDTNSTQDNNLARARKILENIESRTLYVFVAQSKKIGSGSDSDSDSELDEDEIAKLIAEQHPFNETSDSSGTSRSETSDSGWTSISGSIVVQLIKYDYGNGNKNPMDNVMFYDKTGRKFPYKRDEISLMTPQIYREKYIRVYSKMTCMTDDVYNAFKSFCDDKEYLNPKTGKPVRTRWRFDSGGFSESVCDMSQLQQEPEAATNSNPAVQVE